MSIGVMPSCPKAMRFGPCGGVDPDGSCELDDRRCFFLGGDLPVRWDGAPAPRDDEPSTAAGREVRAIMAVRPLVISGFPVRAMRSDDILRISDVLRGRCDAVLSGDAGRSRVQFSPSYRALLLTRAGMRVWSGFNARDRNRVALERELASLRAIGVAAVHCVTGDHTFTGDRPDAAPVFDLESTTMIPRARALGLLTSFAESPSAPPTALRGERAAEKSRAGGQLCLPQYCGDADEVAEFVAACDAAGSTAPVVPGVPVVVDREGAQTLAAFHAAKLPTGYVERLLAADDVRRTGIRLAIEYGRQLLAVPGIAGVAVAGGGRRGDEAGYAEALATVSAELGGGS